MRFHKPAAVAILAAALAVEAQSPPITGYIMRTWTILTRSNKNLAPAAGLLKDGEIELAKDMADNFCTRSASMAKF